MSGTFTLVGRLLHHDHVTPWVDIAVSVAAAEYSDSGDDVMYAGGATVTTNGDGEFAVPLLTETALTYRVSSPSNLFAPVTFTAPSAGVYVDLTDPTVALTAVSVDHGGGTATAGLSITIVDYGGGVATASALLVTDHNGGTATFAV